jgi:hypothetical protein
MSAAIRHDPILVRCRAALAEIYGERLERVVLFGPRARRPRDRFAVEFYGK